MADFNFTKNQLIHWGGEQVYRDAENRYYLNGCVSGISFDGTVGSGTVTHASVAIKTSFSVSKSGLVTSRCPCAVNRDEGRICSHVLAVAIALMNKTAAAESAKAQAAEHTAKMAQAVKNRTTAVVSPSGQPADIRIRLPRDWTDRFRDGRIPVECPVSIPGGGSNISLEYLVQRKIPLKLDAQNQLLLLVLEDICEGRITNPVYLTKTDFLCLTDLLASRGRPFYLSGGNPITIEHAVVESHLTLDLDRETGELIMFLNTDIPGAPDEIPDYIVHGKKGWAFCRGRLWPLKNVLPEPYHSIYSDTIAIPRTETIKFIERELVQIQKIFPVKTEFATGQFLKIPVRPAMSLKIKGSPASIVLTLNAIYDRKGLGISIPAASMGPAGDFAIPDPDDILTFRVRDPEFEKKSIEALNRFGVAGVSGSALAPVVGERNVMNFIGGTIPALRRMGWKVQTDAHLDKFINEQYSIVPVVEITQPPSAPESFEVKYTFYSSENDVVVPHSTVQRAITKGEAFILGDSGKYTFIDVSAVESMREVFRDCASGEGAAPGSFRIGNHYAPFIKASVCALDGSDVIAPPEWRQMADEGNRETEMREADIPPHLKDILRPYQKTGVSWFRFLESNRLGGILADEMGLGKTLQTLVWLSMERVREKDRNLPALVVCPTSLVENWKHEAAKFVPEMKTVVISGSGRKHLFESISSCDLAITSYSLLRRDIDEYSGRRFSAVILDEAQNIKNRATQNAASVKRLDAATRLVLTGTPVENSVADIWSIMDFLLPGYLGRYQDFHDYYEIPISMTGTAESDAAQTKLRRKLHPFLLRRKKIDVASDLPQKIVKVSWCEMSGEQRTAYNEYLAKSRAQVNNMVKERGFTKSRIEILSVLLRLRQICCHPDLILEKPLRTPSPSAKLEQFFEFVDEAVSGGHRILVFSQFVKMLYIIRRALEERSVRYCYLDGASKDRIESVHRFNTDSSIPVFLISLKAGGTGLNLTGADTVIHFDPWWNPAVEDQATDRAHRIGQKNTVYSIKLITAGTVEEKVLEMQARKRAVIGATVESDEQTMEKLTWEDVKSILEL